MKKEWKKYYMYLEDLRKSGKTNMFGAKPYLLARFKELDDKLATKILINWMQNYEEIANEYYK